MPFTVLSERTAGLSGADIANIANQSKINAIQNNLLPEVSLNDGLVAVAIGEAAELSIKENRVVLMSEFSL